MSKIDFKHWDNSTRGLTMAQGKYNSVPVARLTIIANFLVFENHIATKLRKCILKGGSKMAWVFPSL